MKIFIILMKFVLLISVCSGIGAGAFVYYASQKDERIERVRAEQAEHIAQPNVLDLKKETVLGPTAGGSILNMSIEKPNLIEENQQTSQYKIKEKTKAFWDKSTGAAFWGYLNKDEVVFGYEDSIQPDWIKIQYPSGESNITLYVQSFSLEPYATSSPRETSTDQVEIIPNQASLYCQEIWPVSGAIVKGTSRGAHRVFVVAEGADVLAQFNDAQGQTKILYVAKGRREEIRFDDGEYRAIFITGEQVTTCNNFLHDMQIERLRETIVLQSDKYQTLEYNVGRQNDKFEPIETN